jgi:hypothetical protein
MKKLYWTNDAFKTSTNFEHIKTHYYWSHVSVRRLNFSAERFIDTSPPSQCVRSILLGSCQLDLFPILSLCDVLWLCER